MENTRDLQSFDPAQEKFSVEVVEGHMLRVRANHYWVANRMLQAAAGQGYVIENGHHAAIFSWMEKEGIAEMMIRMDV